MVGGVVWRCWYGWLCGAVVVVVACLQAFAIGREAAAHKPLLLGALCKPLRHGFGVNIRAFR